MNKNRYELIEFTTELTRLRLVASGSGKYNIFMIPGGPGMGSEYMYDLAVNLKSLGNIRLVDFPGNGNNKSSEYKYDKWDDYLIELTTQFENVILVGHSFGGALILNNLNNLIKTKAVIIINSTPISNNKLGVAASNEKSLPDPKPIVSEYLAIPSDQAYKKLIIKLKDYFFTTPFQSQGIKFLNNINYDHLALDWAYNGFWPQYEVKLVNELPILIITGQKDYRTPHELFTKDNRFKRKNITIKNIKDVSHFSWVEDPKVVNDVIKKFINFL